MRMESYELMNLMVANPQMVNDALAHYYAIEGDYMATPEEYQMLRDNHDSAIQLLERQDGIREYVAGWLNGNEEG